MKNNGGGSISLAEYQAQQDLKSLKNQNEEKAFEKLKAPIEKKLKEISLRQKAQEKFKSWVKEKPQKIDWYKLKGPYVLVELFLYSKNQEDLKAIKEEFGDSPDAIAALSSIAEEVSPVVIPVVKILQVGDEVDLEVGEHYMVTNQICMTSISPQWVEAQQRMKNERPEPEFAYLPPKYTGKLLEWDLRYRVKHPLEDTDSYIYRLPTTFLEGKVDL